MEYLFSPKAQFSLISFSLTSGLACGHIFHTFIISIITVLVLTKIRSESWQCRQVRYEWPVLVLVQQVLVQQFWVLETQWQQMVVCKLPHCEQSACAGRSQGSSPGHAVLLKTVQMMGFWRLEEKHVYSNPSTCPGFDKSNQPWKYYFYKNQKSA